MSRGDTLGRLTYLAGKDTAKCEEAALVLCRDKLGDIEHEGAVGVAIADGC